MSWAESPNVFGKLAPFTEDTIAWESVAAQASLVGLPREILLKIASFLPPGRKKHAHRGRYGFEVPAKDLLSLSSSCSGLYIFFKPLRFRSLSLGGDNRSLAYARLIAEDLDASRLVCELEITSLCPNHEELSEPYAELISKLQNLETFWFDGIHPLPASVIGALSKLKEFKLEAVHISRAALESIAQLAKTRSWKKGGALEGLKRITLRQDFPTDPTSGLMSPPWLLDFPEEKWEEIEHSLLHAVSNFLSKSASTLEELDLNIHPRFSTSTYGQDLPLRTMLSRPESLSLEPEPSSSSPSTSKKRKVNNQPQPNDPATLSSSSKRSKPPKCDLSLLKSHRSSPSIPFPPDHSLQLVFPNLTTLTLPSTDLTDPTIRSLLSQAPKLQDLSVTHSPNLQVALVSVFGNSTAVLHISYDTRKKIEFDPGTFGKLRKLNYQYEVSSKELEEQGGFFFAERDGEGAVAGERGRSSFLRQLMDGVRGVGLVSLTLGGLYKVKREELEAIAEGCEGLRELEVAAAFWEFDVESIQEALAPLSELVSISINLPAEQTEPPSMVPPIYVLVNMPPEERMTAGEVMDEIDFYFYDGADNTEDEEEEEEEEEEGYETEEEVEDEEDDESSNASDESWRTGNESPINDEDEKDDWHSARGSSVDGEPEETTEAQEMGLQIDQEIASDLDLQLQLQLNTPLSSPTLVPLPPSPSSTPSPPPTPTSDLTTVFSSIPAAASSSSSTTSSSSSSSSEPDRTLYSGRDQNENLFHFSRIAHGFAKQHPKLETFEYVMDPFLSIFWNVQRTVLEEREREEGEEEEEENGGRREVVLVKEVLVYPKLMHLCMMEGGW